MERAIITTAVMMQSSGTDMVESGPSCRLTNIHRIEFPTYLVVVSFLSLIATGVGFDNNSRLINGKSD